MPETKRNQDDNLRKTKFRINDGQRLLVKNKKLWLVGTKSVNPNPVADSILHFGELKFSSHFVFVISAFVLLFRNGLVHQSGGMNAGSGLGGENQTDKERMLRMCHITNKNDVRCYIRTTHTFESPIRFSHFVIENSPGFFTSRRRM